MRGVLNDAMAEDQIERLVGKWQPLAVGDPEVASEALLIEVCAGQIDRGRRDIDAGHVGAAFREARQVDAGAAADVQNAAAPALVKGNKPQEVVQLLEVVVVEVVEKSTGPDGMPCHVEVVNVPVPVVADL